MGQATIHHSEALRPTAARAAQPRRLPRGYGLLVGAMISIGLWVGIFWLVAGLFG